MRIFKTDYNQVKRAYNDLYQACCQPAENEEDRIALIIAALKETVFAFDSKLKTLATHTNYKDRFNELLKTHAQNFIVAYKEEFQKTYSPDSRVNPLLAPNKRPMEKREINGTIENIVMFILPGFVKNFLHDIAKLVRKAMNEPTLADKLESCAKKISKGMGEAKSIGRMGIAVKAAKKTLKAGMGKALGNTAKGLSKAKDWLNR